MRLESSVHLLLVEDEHLIALSIEDALHEGGYAVTAVIAGDEAKSVLEDESLTFHGIITDIRLGNGSDGWDVARRARELHPQMPVVYMSGDSAHEHSAHGVPDSLMIQKPFAPAQIVTAISSLLNLVRPSAPEGP